MNGVYEAFCVIVAFPIILWIGASGTTTDKQSTKICKFLGDISYPVYVIHYPLMYLFYAWLIENQLYTLGETWHVALCVFILSIILAYLCLKLYDEPIRKYLAKRFLSKKRRFHFMKLKRKTPANVTLSVTIAGVFLI